MAAKLYICGTKQAPLVGGRGDILVRRGDLSLRGRKIPSEIKCLDTFDAS